ncbi:MAG: response regulator, partial [Bacteroidota bacterium]
TLMGAIALSAILLVAGLLIYRSGKKNRQLNRQLQDSNEKLHQLDRFKTRLFENINHDLRTPLTLINGYLHRLTNDKDNYLTRQSEEDLDHLQANTASMMEMTNEIQDLILLEEGKLQLKYSRIDLVSHLSRETRMFESLADLSGIELGFESEKQALMIHVDASFLNKIFFNLMSNGFRYTEKGGAIKVNIAQKEGHVLLVVSDTGQGISEEALPHIFDRFYQSPMNEYRSKEGFGIGLAVVRELVELHGGEIAVASKLNEGTEFTVLLPLNLDKPLANEAAETTGEKLENFPTKAATETMIKTGAEEEPVILIVDDHEEIRVFIKELIDEDYQVKSAANGKQALEILQTDHIDLIITDLMMPAVDGYDLIEAIAGDPRLKKIPTMVVSARSTGEDKHKVLDAGVSHFLTKPFDPEELRKKVRNILADVAKRKGANWENFSDKQLLEKKMDQQNLDKLNKIIIARISDSDLTVEDIALELNASRSKTFRIIKEMTGKTPLAYIKMIRMDFVKEMIEAGKVKNSTEAARLIGLKTVTQFTRQYKAHFGEAPQFREQE